MVLATYTTSGKPIELNFLTQKSFRKHYLEILGFGPLTFLIRVPGIACPKKGDIFRGLFILPPNLPGGPPFLGGTFNPILGFGVITWPLGHIWTFPLGKLGPLLGRVSNSALFKRVGGPLG